MPLTTAQQQTAAKVLNGRPRSCPSCGGRQFAFGEIIIASDASTPGMISGPGSVPMLQVACTDCHCIMLFAAVPLGLP